MADKKPDFSVLMTAFNHTKFIEKAVHSVLTQKFNGIIQIVIGIDKSNDNTLEICEQLRNEYPERIELIVHEQNVGMYENYLSVLKKCNGKYIAILEGDDYWTHDQKLQEQYFFFEKHTNCVLSSGKIVIVDENNHFLSQPEANKKKGEILLKEDLIIINRLATLTVAFRKDALRMDQLELLRFSPHLDWGLYLSLNISQKEFAYRFNKVFGAYRQHSGGVYSLVDDEKKNQNVLKTILAIHELDMPIEYKNYLKKLYNNFSIRLNDQSVLSNKQFSKLYDQKLLIYNERGGLKWSYIKSLYKKALRLQEKKQTSDFKLTWELFRQTRLKKKNYLNVFIMILFLFVIFMRYRDRNAKTLFLKLKNG
jgi:glycosyltransferase involved in cell wall biosynthesis